MVEDLVFAAFCRPDGVGFWRIGQQKFKFRLNQVIVLI